MRKSKKISLSIFLFVFISIIDVVFSQQCNDTGFYQLNNTYISNRKIILESLASSVTYHGGFYNYSVGEVPNQVYAMGMCINGTEPTVCTECIKVASDQLLQNCHNETQAYTWSPHKTLCFARYSNISFFGRHDNNPRYSDHKTLEIKSSLNYVVDWQSKMNHMINTIQSKNGSLPNRDYYTSEVLKLSELQALYGFMQCTPDLTQDDCEKCLKMIDVDYEGPIKFRGTQGGFIAYPSCYFRWDLYPFTGALSLSPPPPPPPACPTCKKDSKAKIIVATLVPSVFIMSVLSAAIVILVCQRRKTLPPQKNLPKNPLQYDLETIEVATCTFSKSNMLGRGGFGEVFKGVLQDGSEIAVKRLSKESAQGVQEFKNETSLVAKLQHRNLVSVLGFCMEGEEKILVYEFVPNKSLDHFLFEPTKNGQLDWSKRYKIIVETAKGILYLHHDSPLKIIHRDLKASNILLDAEMKPKVADFGMARILRMDESRADTKRVVGTYGYISPEYMMHGQFSMKSDVYSFGVLVLEIISGKRNSSFHEIDDSGKNLVTHAWRHWRNGSPLELVDAEIGGNYQSNEVIRCIHIALLCVQTDPEQRPSFFTIIGMLNSESTILAVPQSPVYEGLEMCLPPITSVPVSTNDSLIDFPR